jgi:chromosome segregation ATPase
MPRAGEKMSDEARAVLSAKHKALWAEKRAKAAQVKSDAAVAQTHSDATSTALRKISEQIEESKDKLARQLRMADSVEKSSKARMGELRDQIQKMERSLAAADHDLTLVKGEINSRMLYKEQQETEIEEMVNKGNDRLYEVDQEVKAILRRRDELQLELVGLEQQKSLTEQQRINLEKECSAEGPKLEALKLRYELTAKKYRDDLMSIQALITDGQETLDVLRAKAKQVTDEVVAKGNAAVARESAIAAREAELVSRERLLKSRESRYA